MDMNNYMERSTVLVEALPYIQKWYGKTIVIKYGGNAMISQELRSAVISDIILLNLVGVRVVMVHGGGPEIGHMLEKVGKQSASWTACGTPMRRPWTSSSRYCAGR